MCTVFMLHNTWDVFTSPFWRAVTLLCVLERKLIDWVTNFTYFPPCNIWVSCFLHQSHLLFTHVVPMFPLWLMCPKECVQARGVCVALQQRQLFVNVIFTCEFMEHIFCIRSVLIAEKCVCQQVKISFKSPRGKWVNKKRTQPNFVQLTLYMLKFSEETKTCIYILYHYSTLIWRRQFGILPQARQGLAYST